MCCPTCGDVLIVRAFDYGTCRETGYRDAGETFYCDTCGKAVDEGDVLEDGPEAEALREAHEEQIAQRQEREWKGGAA